MIGEKKELLKKEAPQLVWQQTLMSRDGMKSEKSHLRSQILCVSETLECMEGTHSTISVER